MCWGGRGGGGASVYVYVCVGGEGGVVEEESYSGVCGRRRVHEP